MTLYDGEEIRRDKEKKREALEGRRGWDIFSFNSLPPSQTTMRMSHQLSSSFRCYHPITHEDDTVSSVLVFPLSSSLPPASLSTRRSLSFSLAFVSLLFVNCHLVAAICHYKVNHPLPFLGFFTLPVPAAASPSPTHDKEELPILSLTFLLFRRISQPGTIKTEDRATSSFEGCCFLPPSLNIATRIAYPRLLPFVFILPTAYNMVSKQNLR